VTVTPDKAAYQVGDTPTLKVAITNTSAGPCRQNLDKAKLEVRLYQGGQRVWGSNDCYPESTKDVRTLPPRKGATLLVTWSGLGSEPTCVQPRTQIGTGNYTVRATFDGVVGKDVKLVLQ
jgi:hypothetical protein